MGADETGQGTSKAVDDRGTTEAEGRELLQRLRDGAFEGNTEKFAVVLGRSLEEVAALLSGTTPVDDDVVMKARGIAKERGIEL